MREPRTKRPGDASPVLLPGQDTLFGSWAALAKFSPAARLVRTAEAVAGVFPSWAALNNAVLLGPADSSTGAAVAARLAPVYAEAGVGAWALWLSTDTATLDAPDRVSHIDGLRRDTTTLAMRAALVGEHRSHNHVLRTSVASAMRAAGTAPVPRADLAEPDHVAGLDAWVLVVDEVAVAGAWSFLHAADCGIYALGTLPGWRRRGLGWALMQHVMADAQSRGARTATLQSTRMGQRLYESLGFRAVGRYEEWVRQ